MTVNPEQVKLEEKVLEAIIANMQTEVDVGVLVCESLGKTRLKYRLQIFKMALDTLEEFKL